MSIAPIKGQIRIGLIGAGLIGRAFPNVAIDRRSNRGRRAHRVDLRRHACGRGKARREMAGCQDDRIGARILDDPAIDAVFISRRLRLTARSALAAGGRENIFSAKSRSR